LAYGKFSRALKGQDFEMILEWTFKVALAPWLTLQPDMQYIPHSAPSSWVLGISDIIKPHVRLDKEAAQVLMCLGEMEHNRQLICLAQQVTAHTIVPHPTCRWISPLLPLLVGGDRLMRFERLTYAICHGCLHQ
jgi:hypothetical protein